MKQLLPLLAALVLIGCHHVFEFHPYDGRFGGATNINATNIKKIEQACNDKDTLRVAFVSDSHGWFSDLRKAVTDINKRTDIDFVVHAGDLTDCGTTREFERTRDIMNDLKVPYVAMIGNHDFLGTGNQIYAAMFGPVDFVLIAARVKFLFLNTNAVEYDYLAAVPNFDLMEEQITERDEDFDRTVVCMHARPYCEQFNNNVAKAFGHYMGLFKGIVCAVSGHNHRLERDDIYGNGIIYYGLDTVSHGNYSIFTFTPSGYEYEVVAY